MDRVQAQIEARLKEQHVPYLKVYGRMKHPYSIYRKMYAQNKTMDEVLDLFAFRVIVDTVADCYNVLGIIHDLLPSHSGSFQGLYRHAQAEHVPVAPHHRHRCGRHPVRGPNSHLKRCTRSPNTASPRTGSTSRAFPATQASTTTNGCAVCLKIRRTPTPRNSSTRSRSTCSPTRSSSSLRSGDVTNLPAGATPIDFAYSIHSAVGNRMTGAKVNGRIAPLDYRAQKRRHRRNSDFEKRARPQPRLAQDCQIERGTQQNSPVVQKGAPRGKHHQRPHLV